MNSLGKNFDAVIPSVSQDLEGSTMFGEKNFRCTPLARFFMLNFELVRCDLANKGGASIKL